MHLASLPGHFGNMAATLLAPRQLDAKIPFSNHRNVATCTALGVAFQFGITGAVTWDTLLSITCMLIVLGNVRNLRLRKLGPLLPRSELDNFLHHDFRAHLLSSVQVPSDRHVGWEEYPSRVGQRQKVMPQLPWIASAGSTTLSSCCFRPC